MASVVAGLRGLRPGQIASVTIATTMLVLGLAPAAGAIEFGEGRVQIHGFGEIQMRALDEKFKDELDLAQWYNVINVEVELDIAPDGFGPFDLISAYIRAEGRYDAVYSEGFTLFPSINTYGNDSERLPGRLSDATDKEFAGVLPSTDRFGDFVHPRIEGPGTSNIVPPGERLGFPGYDTFFRQFGPDNVSGPNPIANRGIVQLPATYDDPAWYVHEKILDYEFGFKDFRGTANTGTQILGPWLPRNYIRSLALNQDRGNPFRGRVAPTKPRIGTEVAPGLFSFADDPVAVRRYLGDPTAMPNTIVDRLDPLLDLLRTAPDTVFTGLVPVNYSGLGDFTSTGQLLSDSFAVTNFGGDFSGGIAACIDPTSNDAGPIRSGTAVPTATRDCIRGSVDFATGEIYTDPRILGITKITGGGGENPFRPAPVVGNLGRVQLDAMGNEIVGQNPDDTDGLLLAQGLYYPSAGTRNVVKSGRLDELNFNFDETDRSWNRGDAQQRNKELKEAYADLELLDSRLWLRLGLQNIVWGKTELFRTTDQFNPQDLALASLPSLEESRVAVWSARAVYSLYNVGPLEDVRLEFAVNLDEYQPADIGACGEAFTPDIVCSLTTGLYAHSLLGIGIVGIDRPERPWKNFSDMEVGGRIEWRWDRFSFALTDFYGFSDFPYVDAVFFYERAVDLQSGRPLVARLPGQNLGTCGDMNAGEVSSFLVPAGSAVPAWSTAYANHPVATTTGVSVPAQNLITRGGIGWDPGCLRPGGPAGSPGALVDFNDGIDDDIANTNALEWHHANQQIFSWICSGTVGIAAVLDASACAWTVFSTPEVLLPQLLQVPFSEAIAVAMAGSQTAGGAPNVYDTVGGNQKFQAADFTPPTASLNALFNDPLSPIIDRNGDGGFGNGPNDAADCASVDPAVRYGCDLRGFDGMDGRVGLSFFANAFRPDGTRIVFQTLDNSLTNEQRALLGCGPFFGTRCDSSGNVNTIRFPGAPVLPREYARAGGLDFLNMEASVMLQAFPGFEGTEPGHTTWASLDERMQPATVADERSFIGGPVCTRFAGVGGETVKLPGCRGVYSLDIVYADDNDPTSVDHVDIQFENGYLPSIDGCVIGNQVLWAQAQGGMVDVVPTYEDAGADTSQLQTELALCNRALREQAVPRFLLNGFTNDIPSFTLNPAATGTCDGALFGQGEAGTPPGGNPGVIGGRIDFRVCQSELVMLEQLPLIHPTAGCIDSDVWFDARADNADVSAYGDPLPLGGCEFFLQRDLVSEFFEGTAALFQNELAAFSWNMMLFLAASSCDEKSFDLDGLDHVQPTPGLGLPPGALGALREDPQCFDAERPWTPGRCSYATPQFCSNVKGFLGAAGVRRPTARAGGNGTYGRRTFVWHGGGEGVLTYEQRNVFGFSMDFAEDVTKTNWGMEFTWIEDIPNSDNDSPTGITYSDAYNLTLSVDRPTFINFLNPNRTFFFNSQWFFNYRPDYNNGFTSNGPFNVLFTFAVFTGYFQDRVQPQLVTVYDFNSISGGVLPSLQYRFTESFSVTIGMLYFFGRTQLKDMPLNELGPPSNRAVQKIYDVGVDNGLSVIRQRDEVFMRLRWTF